MQNFTSPFVFVRRETGNLPPMGRLKQINPPPPPSSLNSAIALPPFDKINTDKENTLIFQ